MRRFVVLAHEATTDPSFSLDDLPDAGRLDVCCRCVNSAFLLSHGIREDVQLTLVLQDRVAITFEAGPLRSLSPDERAIAGLLRRALERVDDAVGRSVVESSPGVTVAKRSFQAVLDDFPSTTTPIHLVADGEPVTAVTLPEDPAFILSDHRPFTAAEESALEDIPADRISLGPETIHADHAITIAHNALDTDGFTRY